MPLVSMRQLLDHAAENSYGLPAFNRKQPGTSPGHHGSCRRNGQPGDHAGVGRCAQICWRGIPPSPHRRGNRVLSPNPGGDAPGPRAVTRHLSYGDPLRFSSVMMDGSLMEDGKTPSSYDYNVEVSRKVVEMAHAIGVTVEAELGCLGSLETGQAGEEDGIGAEGTLDHSMLLTDPDQAADFVKRTDCDALAIAIGTSHGAYKFTRKPTGDILPSTASRPSINAFRTPIWSCMAPRASPGVARDHSHLRRRHEGNVWGAGGGNRRRDQVRRPQNQHRHRHSPRDDGRGPQVPVREPSKFDPREYNKPAREAAKLVCKARYEAFGCAGMASRIKPVSLDRIAARYKAGELAQVVR